MKNPYQFRDSRRRQQCGIFTLKRAVLLRRLFAQCLFAIIASAGTAIAGAQANAEESAPTTAKQMSAAPAAALSKKFPVKVHEIARPGGRGYGQTALVDVDGDGDLDFIAGQRGGDVRWFEYRGPSTWVAHRIGTGAQTDVGGAMFDVNGDGFADQVSGATLFIHPGKQRVREEEWRRIPDVAMSSHDHRVGDIDGDGQLDLIAMQEKRGVVWFKIPRDAMQPWIAHDIGPARHAGLAVGDIDGDGDADVVRSDWWFENADGKGTRWIRHENIPFPGKRYNEFGMATQSRLADLDRDGDLDVVMTDGETTDATLAWLENVDGRGREWRAHTLATGLGALHSLIVADFDNDGDLDVFTCEFHIGGEKRWFIFENTDGRGRTFVSHVILRGVEGHETVAGDVDGDGDIDFCSKPWNSDRHVFVENLLIDIKR